jgi:hypothetical protein
MAKSMGKKVQYVVLTLELDLTTTCYYQLNASTSFINNMNATK